MKKEMKNVFGKNENLTLFNKQGKRVYQYDVGVEGYSCECTYNEEGTLLTFKDSDGYKVGFEIPNYTMKELVQMIGQFKLIEE
jgi:hypothetical protein